MSWVRLVAARLHGLFERKRLERELDDELRFHLEMQIEDNLEAGMNPVEARYAALRSFGAIEPMKETYRERRTFALLETIGQDIRYALRTLRKNPGFTVASVAVLALAIGANTTMFSVVNAVLLRPLPYASPEHLVMLWTGRSDQSVRESRSAYWNFEEWRRQNKSFADLAVFDPASATLTSDESAQRIGVVRASANFFTVLGVQPFKGRMFSTQETEQHQRLAVISYAFWQTRLGGSQSAIGANVELDGVPYQIIGILPAEFRFPRLSADVWIPQTTSPDWQSIQSARGTGSWFVVGRLRPNTTVERAQAEMDAIARRLDEQLPASERNLGVSVVPLSFQVIGYKARLALYMLIGAVLCVLLIAATNAAGLSLARSASREREMAIRTALGASRARIVRQLFTESLALALISGLAGLLVTLAGIRLVLAIRLRDISRLQQLGLDPQVFVCALVLCLVTGIVVGLAPAMTIARRDLRFSIQEGGRGLSAGVAVRAMRRALVVTEYALAITLLAGAGLLIRSLWSVESVHLGFRPERVLAVQLSSPAFSAIQQQAGFYNRVLERIQSLPSVENAGIIENLFINSVSEQTLTTEGERQGIFERLQFREDGVSAGFFRAIGTPLEKGRFFSSQDGPNSPRVAIINDALAGRLWPGDDPLGKKIEIGPPDSAGPWLTIVGVVGDMRRRGLENEPIPQVFEPISQNPPRLATLLVRTSGSEPLEMMRTIEAAVHQVEKFVPVYGVTTLDDQLSAFLTERRFQTMVITAFSGVALLLAAIGIFGHIHYSVATRTQEIGIRMALGAQAGEIFGMFIEEGLKLSLAGLGLGLIAAFALGMLGRSLLFGVTSTDPLTFIGGSLLLIVTTTVASYFPARRAMEVDPLEALRQE
ncbi:MAG TPA: ABC transporter permease [Bryobacteraceae bacterium]|jgi:predicted permease|nr:ABC transporter permease [Bryobacteraceae bacterium]